MNNIDNQKMQEKRKKIILTLHQELYSIISKETATSPGIKPNSSVVINHKYDTLSELGKNILTDWWTISATLSSPKSVLFSYAHV
jgi:hypothetical protein